MTSSYPNQPHGEPRLYFQTRSQAQVLWVRTLTYLFAGIKFSFFQLVSINDALMMVFLWVGDCSLLTLWSQDAPGWWTDWPRSILPNLLTLSMPKDQLVLLCFVCLFALFCFVSFLWFFSRSHAKLLGSWLCFNSLLPVYLRPLSHWETSFSPGAFMNLPKEINRSLRS